MLVRKMTLMCGELVGSSKFYFIDASKQVKTSVIIYIIAKMSWRCDIRERTIIEHDNGLWAYGPNLKPVRRHNNTNFSNHLDMCT